MPLLLSFTPISPLTCPHSLTITSLLSPKPRKSLRISNPILDRSLSLFSYIHVLPSDFAQRWRNLVETSEKAEARLCQIPVHLVQAVTASEDCRFFYHLGVDPHGIGRAVVNYPKGGGGSTITQQASWINCTCYACSSSSYLIQLKFNDLHSIVIAVYSSRILDFFFVDLSWELIVN